MEIRCVCGKAIAVPEKPAGSELRCPQCDAVHRVPAPKAAAKLGVVIPCVVLIVACLGFLIYKIVDQGDPPPPPPDAKALYEEGLVLYRNGQIIPALEKFGQAVSLDPKAIDAQYYLGFCLKQVGRSRRAIEPLTRATEANPNDPTWATALADAHLTAGFRKKAIEILERVVSQHQNHDAAVFSLANAYLQEDRLGMAEPLMAGLVEKTRYTVPSVVDFYHRTLLYLGRFEDARRVIERARKSYKDEAALVYLSIMEASQLREEGKLSDAAAKLEGALSLVQPQTLPWHQMVRWLTQLGIELGQYDRVASLSESVLARPLTLENMVFRSDAAILRLQALVLLGRADQARKEAAKYLPQFDAEADKIRDALATLRLFAGKGTREELAAVIETLPKRAHNDFYLILAIHARSTGDEAGFKSYHKKADETTLGRNYPHHLIERLRP